MLLKIDHMGRGEGIKVQCLLSIHEMLGSLLIYIYIHTEYNQTCMFFNISVRWDFNTYEIIKVNTLIFNNKQNTLDFCN